MRTISTHSCFFNRRAEQRGKGAVPTEMTPVLEESYQQDLENAKFRSFSQACMLCVLLYVSFGVLDVWALPSGFVIAWLVRALVVIATLVCLQRAWRQREWFMRHYHKLVIGLYGLWGAGIEAIIMLSQPGEAAWTHYYAGLTLVTTALYTWTYATPRAAAGLGVALALSYLLIAVGLQELHLRPESSALVAIVFFLVSTNLIGILSMLAREKFSRQAFMLKHMLRKDLEQADTQQRVSQHMSEHDHLTGLPNRLKFELRAEELIREARISGTSVGLLFIDLDGFKPINDVHGHSAGDAVLCDVAKKLLGAIRSEDMVARLGGDEFVIAMPLAAGNADRLHSLRLSLAMRIGQVLGWEGRDLRVTASIGAACFPADGDSAGAVLAKADHAMYLDKGRFGQKEAPRLRRV